MCVRVCACVCVCVRVCACVCGVCGVCGVRGECARGACVRACVIKKLSLVELFVKSGNYIVHLS